MDIPSRILRKLSLMGITNYEMRVFLVILRKIYSSPYFRDRNVKLIKLTELAEETGLAKTHIAPAAKKLEERNMITMVRISRKIQGTAYSLVRDPAEWEGSTSRRLLKVATQEQKYRFLKWFKEYPILSHREEAEMVYLRLLRRKGINPDKIDEALSEYIKIMKKVADRQGRIFNPDDCMTAPEFLRKYKSFLSFRNIKRGAWRI